MQTGINKESYTAGAVNLVYLKINRIYSATEWFAPKWISRVYTNINQIVRKLKFIYLGEKRYIPLSSVSIKVIVYRLSECHTRA